MPDEKLGYGAALEINDDGDGGGVGAFVAVPNITSMNMPSVTRNVVESRRLDLPENFVVKLKGLKNRDSITVTSQLTNDQNTRLKTIAEGETDYQFRFTVPDETGATGTQVTVNGFIANHRITSVETEKINEMETTIEVYGPDV